MFLLLTVIVTYPYQVLATDYTNYTIKFSCKQVGLYNLRKTGTCYSNGKSEICGF